MTGVPEQTEPGGFAVGTHDLVIQQGDGWFVAYCSCGDALTGGDYTTPFDRFGSAWERHVMNAHRDCACEVCSL